MDRPTVVSISRLSGRSRNCLLGRRLPDILNQVPGRKSHISRCWNVHNPSSHRQGHNHWVQKHHYIHWQSTSSQESYRYFHPLGTGNIPLLWQECWDTTLQQTQMAAYTSGIVPPTPDGSSMTKYKMRQPSQNFQSRNEYKSHTMLFARTIAKPECQSRQRKGSNWGCNFLKH